MITANELRVGNFLYRSITNDNEDLEWIFQQIFADDILDFENEHERLNTYYKPIPLTEEILLKCGFVKNINIDYRFHHIKIDITIDMDDYGLQISDTWEFGSITYLHELQNLYYALTKKELEIKL